MQTLGLGHIACWQADRGVRSTAFGTGGGRKGRLFPHVPGRAGSERGQWGWIQRSSSGLVCRKRPQSCKTRDRGLGGGLRASLCLRKWWPLLGECESQKGGWLAVFSSERSSDVFSLRGSVCTPVGRRFGQPDPWHQPRRWLRCGFSSSSISVRLPSPRRTHFLCPQPPPARPPG